jgi:hypothetical protein
MTTTTKPATVKPNDDGQFVGCVDLASIIKSAKKEKQHNSLTMQTEDRIPVFVEWHNLLYHLTVQVQHVNSTM